MEFIGITATGWGAILVTLSMAILTVMMFVLGKERIHFVWSWFCLIVTVWIGAFYGAVISRDPVLAELCWKISYVGVILMPFAFIHFIVEFIDILKENKKRYFILFLLYITALVFIFLDLQTNLIINGVEFLFNEIYYARPGLLHPYFMALYGILVFIAFYLVYRKYKQNQNDQIFQQRVIYFFISNLIAFIGGSLNFLPIYGIKIPPITNISVLIGAALLSYAILRFQLFNARIVTAQLLTLILVSFTFVRLIISDSLQLIIFNVLLLIITLFVGLNLIKSVRREVEQREKIEGLNKSLELANQGQANLIHVINHQIKGYLAKSRNIFSELLTEPAYGPVSDASKPMMQEGFNSLTEGAAFVQQILSTASIDKGTFQYTMEKLNFKDIVSEVFEKEKEKAEQKKLKFELNISDGEYEIKGDKMQLKEAVRNLIDNSVIYTLTGSIKISLSNKEDHILLQIVDTGVGIKEEDKPRLFTKGGRGMDSIKVNVNSSGYGLAFVKGVIEAHGGYVWAESAGPGKGSTFSVELPRT